MMENSFGRPPAKLFPGAGVCLLCMFAACLPQDVAESLRFHPSTPLFPSKNTISAYKGITVSDVTDAGGFQRHNLDPVRVTHSAKASTSFLSAVSVLSTEPGKPVPESPAFTIVELGLFYLINPIPEDSRKLWDLSWLAQVLLTREDREPSNGTQDTGQSHERNQNDADNRFVGVGEPSAGKGGMSSEPVHGGGERESRTNSDLPGHQEENQGHPIDRPSVEPNEEGFPHPAGTQREGKTSGDSLAEAIEATGDAGLIEEAGLEGNNPWRMIDDADERDRRRRKQGAEAGDHGKPLPGSELPVPASEGAGGPAAEEKEDNSKRQSQEGKEDSAHNLRKSGIFVGSTVTVDARFVFEETAGELHVQHGQDAPKLQRVILVENRLTKPLVVFARTTDAVFTEEKPTADTNPASGGRCEASSFLQSSACFLKQSFLQVSSLIITPSDDSHDAAAQSPVLTSVDAILEEYRQSQEDRPGKCGELLIDLVEDDAEDGASSHGNVLNTEKGAQILGDLRQLMQRLFGQRRHAVQLLKALGFVIVSFPSDAEINSEVKEVVEFVRKAFDGLMSRWSFSREVTVMAGALNNSSPISSPESASESSDNDNGSEQDPFFTGGLPEDPELQKKLYGLFMTNVTSAWLHGEKGYGVRAAVLDTGVSVHPDLDCNFWINPNEQADGTDSDGNGLLDDIRGYNFDGDHGDPDDENGHGTHVAGIIGACANGMGVVGGSHESKVISLRFMDKDGAGALGNSIRAIEYAVDGNAHILNNSWGGPDNDVELRRALQATANAHNGKGILIVNAAGNEATNNDMTPSYPANWSTPNTISVAAVDQHGRLASFSNWGPKTVDTAAPGVKIFSTMPGGGYQFLSGTSMAAPHVTAIAALVYGAFLRNGYHPPAAEVKDILRLTVRKIPHLEGVVAWEGVPNAKDAVLMARMGGMWMQCACNDMIVDVPPGGARKLTLYFSGYSRGKFRAHLTLDVFNEQRVRVDKIKIPFSLVSTEQPKENKHTDAEVKAAYSESTKLHVTPVREESDDLCRLQAKFLAEEPLLPLWAIILLAVAGSIVLLAVLFGYIACVKRRRRRITSYSPEEQAILYGKADHQQASDDLKDSSEFLILEHSLSRRTEASDREVYIDLISEEGAYR